MFIVRFFGEVTRGMGDDDEHHAMHAKPGDPRHPAQDRESRIPRSADGSKLLLRMSAAPGHADVRIRRSAVCVDMRMCVAAGSARVREHTR
jgi:hypothetical protein